ncbi:MAG: patatin-like phospholipase family protein, partial [Tumebacillaceae bacterium]
LDYNWRGIVAKVFLFRKRFLDGWIKGARLRGLFEQLTERRNVSAFRIPCGIVATELRQGKPMVFSNEPVPGFLSETGIEIALAVQASCSIPIVFQPVRWKDHVLADGGVTVNCPVQIVRAMGAEKVISVDTVTPFANDKIGALRSGMGIFSHVINLNLRNQMAHEHQHSDYVLHPHVGYVGALEFAKVSQCVEVGYKYTRERMDEIKSILRGNDDRVTERAVEL